MEATGFERHKIKRALNQRGVYYTFTRELLNSYGEPSGVPETVTTLKGIFHERINYTALDTTEAANVQRKYTKTPMIMCLFEDAADILVDDDLVIGAYRYRVTDVNNVNNFGVIGDISLEAVV